jgi:hypothetical protein
MKVKMVVFLDIGIISKRITSGNSTLQKIRNQEKYIKKCLNVISISSKSPKEKGQTNNKGKAKQFPEVQH